MQFQHGTPINQAGGGIGSQLYVFQQIPNGGSYNFLTSASATWAFTLQQIFVSWEGATQDGDIFFQTSGIPGRLYLVQVEQDKASGNLVIPCWNLQFGNYGIRVLSNGTGGNYQVTLFYTQMSF